MYEVALFVILVYPVLAILARGADPKTHRFSCGAIYGPANMSPRLTRLRLLIKRLFHFVAAVGGGRACSGPTGPFVLAGLVASPAKIGHTTKWKIG